MRLRICAAAICAAAVVTSLVTGPTAAAAIGDGSIKVTVNAPDGVPATIALTGKTRQIVAKPPSGTSSSTTLTMPAGAYHVNLPRINFGGVAYVSQLLIPDAVVLPSWTTQLHVTYVAEGGATALHATSISQDSLALAWSAPAGAKFSLRRAAGTVPPAQRTDGVDVPVNGATAVDHGLKPGTQYSYALFTLIKGCWYGPLTIVAGTAPPAGSSQASYIASPSTLLARASDVASAASTGSGVRLVLQNQVPTPLLGAGVVLPISTTLPGGFLGKVNTISADGHTIGLTGAGLSDAFDFYEINVPDFTIGETSPASSPQTKPAGFAKAAAVGVDCASSGGQTITFTPQVSLGGHFKTKLDKYSFFGVDVPVGASVDMGLTATVTGAAAVGTTASYSCDLKSPSLFKTLTTTPVPISVDLTPIAHFTVSGSVRVSNIGLSATAGVQVSGTMSFKSGASFTGSSTVNVVPLTPQVTANGSVALKVGGDLIVGPGAGTPDAGVIAGVEGEFDPIDASFEPRFTASDARFNACVVTKAAFSRTLSLTARAWLGDWDVSKKIDLPAFSGSTPYPGTPFYLPAGCDNLPGGGTPDSLLGTGVTKVDDSTSGSSDQWGHVDGFVPGKKTWVLSTGLIADALGSPSKFASTGIGGPGDADLTKLAGYPTYDAASYQVTVVPTGTSLHVRYVFASEEYPEYVGSSYNDVMAVWVNGSNCATVPGTDQAVSVNTVNANTNSAYYVDNSTGAAGYSTSMDGLTTPLTCTVPVTPGKPVTVKISVADTSDNIYDSAVALVDGGIWTD